jgi:hypothetical protein
MTLGITPLVFGNFQKLRTRVYFNFESCPKSLGTEGF